MTPSLVHRQAKWPLTPKCELLSFCTHSKNIEIGERLKVPWSLWVSGKKKNLIKTPQSTCFQNVYLERRMGGCVLELASVSLIPTLKAIILSAFTQGWFCMLNWIEFGTCYDQSFESPIQKCHSVVYKNWGQSFWNKWSLSWITEIEGWIWFYSQLNITNHKPLHIRVDVPSFSMTIVFYL